MNWQSLVKVLIELFRPLAKRWLEELFRKLAADALSPLDNNPTLAIADVFAAARAEVLETYWFPRRALKALDACQRTAIARAADVYDAATGMRAQPVLTGKEYDSLVGL